MPTSAEMWPAELQTFLVPALFVLLLIGLAHCFFGYLIFRAELVLAGVAAGAFLPLALLLHFRPDPTGVEMLGACLLGSAGGGLAAWYYYRGFFAVDVALNVLALFVGLTADTTVNWVFGAIFAIGLGVLAYMYTRPIWIVLTGISGAAMTTVAGVAILAAGPVLALVATMAASPSGTAQAVAPMAASPWVLVAAAAAFLALAVGGIVCQFRLTDRYRLAVVPIEVEKKDKKKPPARKQTDA